MELSIFLITAIMSLVFILLSLFWDLIYRVLGKSGKCRIILENMENGQIEREFEVGTGSSVLSLLREQGINYPSSCPGQGICGQCKIMADAKLGGVTGPERVHINGEEAVEKKGFITRLACQCKIETPGTYRFKIRKNDLSLQVYTAEVIGRTYLTADKVELVLKIPERSGFIFKKDQRFSFKAGQYVSLEVPREFVEWYYWLFGGRIKTFMEGIGKFYQNFDPEIARLASYSIASGPSEGNIIKLIVRNVPSDPRELKDINTLGPAFINDTFFYPGLKVGDRVRLRGPFGYFFLQPQPHEAVGIAGGSGMAPIASIVEAWLNEERRPERLVFFIGERRFQDIAHSYLEKWLAWQEKFSNFIFVPVLSGGFSGDNPEKFNEADIKSWEGLSSETRRRLIKNGWVDEAGKSWRHHTGFIPPIMKNYLSYNPELFVYECGPAPMILTCNNELISLCGIKPENTLFDDFFNISTPPTVGISNTLLFKKNATIKNLPDSWRLAFIKRIDKVLLFELILPGKFSEAEAFVSSLSEICGGELKTIPDRLEELLLKYSIKF